MKRFLGLGAALAILGGALRIVSAFVPHTPNNALLEALYGVIDLSFLFGLVALYCAVADQVGWIGLFGFMVALAGNAAIVGPDNIAFGVDFYRLGATAMVVGLGLLSVQLLRGRMYLVASLAWIGALGLGLAYAALAASWLFQAAGVALAVGFIAAGIGLLRTGPTQQSVPLAGSAHPR
jgi:hypothetical protein